jgi:protein-tyrosine phosphatase
MLSLWKLPYILMATTIIPNFILFNNIYLIFSILHISLLFLFLTNIGNFDNQNLKAISILINFIALFFFMFIDKLFVFGIFITFWIPTIYYFYIGLKTINYSKINENIFLGNIKTASNEEIIKKENISCSLEIHDKYKNNKRIEGVEYLSLEFDDRGFVVISEYLKQSIKFLEECEKQNKKVLVHCSFGVSRSASMVIGYLISKGVPFHEAFKMVRSKRDLMDINYGFKNQLLEYERSLKNNFN